MRAQFRIVDLLWLILVSFFAVAWWVDHRRYVELKEALRPAEQAKAAQPPPAGAYSSSGWSSYPATMAGMPGK